jgi:hypothetical protein
MGLKGYRLWAMGQLDSTCRAPPRTPPPRRRRIPPPPPPRSVGAPAPPPPRTGPCTAPPRRQPRKGRSPDTPHPRPRIRRRGKRRRRTGTLLVALQVAFERQTLKPVFHLIGYRLWVGKAVGYGLWVKLIQCAEPHLLAPLPAPQGTLPAPLLPLPALRWTAPTTAAPAITEPLHSLLGGVRLVTWTTHWLSSIEPSCIDNCK